MDRLKKLLWMILIFWIVFFIICDEKWIKIWLENNHIVFNKIEKKPYYVEDKKTKLQFNPNAVYKNSTLIHINYEFENPRILRNSMNKKSIKNQIVYKNSSRVKIYSWFENPITLRKSVDDDSTISNTFKWWDNRQNIWVIDLEDVVIEPEIKQEPEEKEPEIKQIIKESEEDILIAEPEIKQEPEEKEPEIIEHIKNSDNKTWTMFKIDIVKPIVYHPIKKYKHDKTVLNLSKWVEISKIEIEKYSWKENLTLNLSNGRDVEPKIIYKNSNRVKLYTWFENPRNMRKSAWIDEAFLVKQENNKPTIIWLDDNNTISSTLDENKNNEVSISLWVEENKLDEDVIVITEPEDNSGWNNDVIWVKEVQNHVEANPIKIDKPELFNHSINISEWKLPEVITVELEKYHTNKHNLSLKKWVVIKHDFIVENNQEVQETKIWLSDSLLESLLENEEINIDTLESENDEFLQKVFEKTRDTDVMNLIVENYLNEYQFIKAKNFIENLPETYHNELKPMLNLRVAFNSFPLTSKTITENLVSLVQEYVSKDAISQDDKNRYLWIISLIDRDYDKFFEISVWFTTEKHKAFASKLQWYKDQIEKQMWMPEYYFDTLVSLELFNQWLFQPAKVLALYSLQQNSNYILPYQVLAYANFLTNSWDTSIEYFKKLEDLDSNNAEKYRFLMWVASYRNWKYEQSVVMLSMVKDESLRLDTQRYLINDYLKLNQKNKLISSRNKLLWYENLVASDFYTYFYETFFHPYSQWEEFQLYAFDTELANKMLRVCTITLQNEERAVCTYGTIGRNIALWQFDGMEQYLLNLVSEYPQWYLYQALWEYYIKQREMDKAKAYLLKAVSLSQNKSEKNQIKKLLEDAM